MTRRASVLRSARLRQFRCPIILLTLEVLWWRLVTYLSALRCTCSSWVVFSLVYMSHTGQTYASYGWTRDLYACSLTVVGVILIFLQKKCRVCLCYNTIYMDIPFKVQLHCDTQIFGFIRMFKLVSMQDVCISIGALFRVMEWFPLSYQIPPTRLQFRQKSFTLHSFQSETNILPLKTVKSDFVESFKTAVSFINH